MLYGKTMWHRSKTLLYKMNLYQQIIDGEAKISLIGLGYVGMPIAVEFAKKVKVIGFDLNAQKIELYKQGIDPTQEVGNEAIANSTVEFTSDEKQLKGAKFHIIAVPTPINLDKTPDLFPVESASELLGRNLTKGSIVVYESTVFPGVTEDICIPILEKHSGLKCGTDFKIGYSPERINPGDKLHRLENITKIVSGMDAESLDTIAKVYEIVVKVGTYRAGSIKVAEAAKVVENSQRDINIAFMNELSLVFDKMGIDTNEVVEAMNTKWNALKFYPGLVGGHCIGVDPYYFIYQAARLGYHSQIIAAGRKINDSMGKFVAESTIKQIIKANIKVKEAKVCILGFTFKENCPDTRNSKIVDIVNELNEYEISPIIIDPVADKSEAFHEYGLQIEDISAAIEADVLILAVSHDEFKCMSLNQLGKLFKAGKNSAKVIIDVKSILNSAEVEQAGYRYWRL